MDRYMTLVMTVAAITSIAGVVAASELSATLEKGAVAVLVDGKPFTVYKFSPDQKYPYFWPVNGPVSGASVTTESSEPYPHHHSLFFGCDKVNGGNYWQESNRRGQIVSEGPEIIEGEGDRVVFTDTCLWRIPKRDPVIRDRRRISVTAPNESLRILDFEIELEPLVDVVIGKTNHALFSVRVMPELGVKSGGTLVNAEGKSGEAGTFGQASSWCDYYGTRKGVTEGIAILQHPENPWFPSKWFTRDYGFFSPTPMYWPKGGEMHQFAKGERITLKYRVVVHAGGTEAAGIAEIFSAYE